MLKSGYDVLSPSDRRRNQWKRKHPDFSSSESLAALSSCLRRRCCFLCLGPATPGCHLGVGVDQRRLWCEAGLIMTVGFADQPKCVLRSSAPQLFRDQFIHRTVAPRSAGGVKPQTSCTLPYT